MAFLNAGAGATTPGTPDPRFALHTREGVVDKTGIGNELTNQMNYQLGSDAVKTAGKVIKEGITGYHIAKLEQRMNEEAIQPFLRSMEEGGVNEQNASQVAESKAQLLGLRQQKEGIFGNMMANDTPYPADELAANESGVVKEGQKLKAALGQGRMTQAEFEMRLRKVTREAINRNPGLTKQLLAHAQLVEQQSGIRQVKDPAKELDKVQAAQDKQEMTFRLAQYKATGVYADPSRLGEPHYLRELDSQAESRMLDKQTHEELTRLDAAGKIADTMTRKQRDETAPSATRGAFLEAMDVLATHAGRVQVGSAKDKTDAIANMGIDVDKAILDFSGKMARAGISPDVRKEQIDMFEGSLRRAYKIVSEDTSGKTLADVLDNQKNSAMRVQELNQLHTVDVAALNTRAKLGADPAWIKWMRDNPENAKVVEAQYASITRGIADPDSLKALYERELSPSMSNAAWFTSKALTSGENEVAGKIITTAKELTVDFADKHFGSDVTGKVRAQGDIIREIGKLKDMDNINLSTEDRASFRALTGDYLQYSGTKFSREVAKLEADYGVDVYTRFDKDGRMLVEQKALNGRQAIAPPSEITKLNALYATAFNDSVQAMAAIHKDSWASSSQTLVNNYADTWQFKDPGNPLLEIVKEKKTLGSRGQNENNPLNLKEPGKNVFQSFGNREEGVKAAYKQLQSYKNGTSAAVGNETLDTPAKMLAKWNNAAEKGSANDNVYLNNVKAYSGLSDEELRSPVSNKDTWVDLIYGMARAEGNKKLTRNEIRNAIGD